MLQPLDVVSFPAANVLAEYQLWDLVSFPALSQPAEYTPEACGFAIPKQSNGQLDDPSRGSDT